MSKYIVPRKSKSSSSTFYLALSISHTGKMRGLLHEFDALRSWLTSKIHDSVFSLTIVFERRAQ